jgi:hypothetical protein
MSGWCTCKEIADALWMPENVHRRLTEEHRLIPVGPDRRLNRPRRAAQVRQAVRALGKFAHDLLAGPFPGRSHQAKALPI